MMASSKAIDPVEFLVRRRFGSLSQAVPSSLSRSYPPGTLANWSERLAKRAAYVEELKGLPSEQLQARFRAAVAEDLAAKEASCVFNEPFAIATPATYDYWAKAAYWEIDEGIALVLEREPRFLCPKLKHSPLTFSDTARRFYELRSLASRSHTMGDLALRNLPGFFLAWVKRMRIEVPYSLEEAVTEQGHHIVDWQSLYERAKAAFDNNRESLEELVDAQKLRIEGLLTQVEQLRQQLANQTPKELSTRERESLLKLVIGMATAGYAYDPTAKRSGQSAEIANDLASRGIPLDVDTVRKWLRQAAELLPQNRED